MKYDSILGTIGRTPIVKLTKFSPPHATIYAKVEAFNPMGSVKDRLALAVIEDAERSGALKPGQTVIEATSGNTGIGLAMVCAQRGYPLVIVMAENFSIERRRLMRFLGAQVVLTPAADRGSGMLAKAVELAETHGWFLTRQFENEANADMHSATTAREIIDDFRDEPLHYWVSAYGTGGTLKGVSRTLRAEIPGIKIIATEPDNSQVLGTGLTDRFRPHPIQGTSPDFIPKLTADARPFIDEIVPVNGGDALRLARELAVCEGIFAGISSGAALAAAMNVAESAPKGSNILCMLPDTGERYLSTPLFDDIAVDMTAEEEAISKSSPRFRFDIRPAPPPVAAVASAPADAEAAAFVEKQIREQPVMMFALEWCEFCWAARKLFKAHDIAFYALDLDSVAFQKDDWGGRVRRAVGARVGVPTIPQIFVAGEWIGGTSELFEAARTGELRRRLTQAGVAFDAAAKIDYAALLPKWLKKSA